VKCETILTFKLTPAISSYSTCGDFPARVSKAKSQPWRAPALRSAAAGAGRRAAPDGFSAGPRAAASYQDSLDNPLHHATQYSMSNNGQSHDMMIVGAIVTETQLKEDWIFLSVLRHLSSAGDNSAAQGGCNLADDQMQALKFLASSGESTRPYPYLFLCQS
jgi:hypothetical protein